MAEPKDAWWLPDDAYDLAKHTIYVLYSEKDGGGVVAAYESKSKAEQHLKNSLDGDGEIVSTNLYKA